MKVAIQGAKGSYHHQASNLFFSQDIDIIPCETFSQVFEAVDAGVVDRGVVAIENSLYGSINDTYDLLLKYTPNIVGEVYIHVALQLLAKKDIEPKEVTDIYSQAPALAEAKSYIKENMPNANIEEYIDTAMAARFVSNSPNERAAAIASQAAGELYNLKVIAENIEDHKHNYTRFFVITKNPMTIVGANKSTLIIHTSHTPGSLYKAIGAFADNGINLSKLESRPIVNHESWQYIFYIDFESDMSSENAKKAIKELEKQGIKHTDLGSYARGTLPNGIR